MKRESLFPLELCPTEFLQNVCRQSICFSRFFNCSNKVSSRICPSLCLAFETSRLLPLIFLPKTACLFLLLFCTSKGSTWLSQKRRTYFFCQNHLRFPRTIFSFSTPHDRVLRCKDCSLKEQANDNACSTVCSFAQGKQQSVTTLTTLFLLCEMDGKKREGRKKDNCFTC